LRRAAGVAVAIGMAAVVLPVAPALLGVDYLNSRNVIGALVPLSAFLALALGTRRARPLGPAAAALLVVLSLTVVVASATDSALQRPDWRAVGDALGPAEEPRVVAAASDIFAVPLVRYLPSSRPLLPEELVEVRELVFVTYLHGDEEPCPGGACAMSVRPPPSLPDVGEFELTERTTVERFTIIRLRADALQPVSGGEITLLLGEITGGRVPPRAFIQPAGAANSAPETASSAAR
jgi:hypothetical protein